MLLIFVLLYFGASPVTSSFELGGLMTGNQMAGVPLGISLGDGQIDVEGVCLEPGFACQNCTHAVTCIPLPGGFLKVPLQDCDKEQTCNAKLGQCSSEHVPECQTSTSDYQHTCEQVGIFPDAHDCRKFHLCSPPEDAPFGRPADHRSALCPRHYGYDPQTAQCSIKLTKGHCSSKLVPECTSVGQYGVLPLSLNYYYVCLFKKGNLYPQVFLCPHGWYFWGGFCRPEKHEKIDEMSIQEVPKNIETGHNEIQGNEEKTLDVSTTEETVESTTKPVEDRLAFFDYFTTEKTSTYAPDTFLADKFDFSHYETGGSQNDYRIFNSFEADDGYKEFENFL